jgi:hypothetical protein
MTPESAEIWRETDLKIVTWCLVIVHRILYHQTLWNIKTKLHFKIHVRDVLAAIKDFELGWYTDSIQSEPVPLDFLRMI